MKLKYKGKCCVCDGVLPANTDVAGGFKLDGEWLWLCNACYTTAGGGNVHTIIEAWYMQYDNDFGGPDCDADHEDYYILEALGVPIHPDDETD